MLPAVAAAGVTEPGVREHRDGVVVVPERSAATPAEGGGSAPGTPPPVRGKLPDPSRAQRRRRHLFDPQKGWVRRFERAASLFLARHV